HPARPHRLRVTGRARDSPLVLFVQIPVLVVEVVEVVVLVVVEVVVPVVLVIELVVDELAVFGVFVFGCFFLVVAGAEVDFFELALLAGESRRLSNRLLDPSASARTAPPLDDDVRLFRSDELFAESRERGAREPRAGTLNPQARVHDAIAGTRHLRQVFDEGEARLVREGARRFGLPGPARLPRDP